LCRSRPTPFLPHPLSPSVLKTEVVCSARLWTPAAAEVQICELLRGIRASIGRIWVVAPGAALPFAGADAELPHSPAVGCCGHGARLREVSFAGKTQEPARTATSGRAGGRRRARASPGSPGHCHRLAQIHALLALARPHRRHAPRPVAAAPRAPAAASLLGSATRTFGRCGCASAPAADRLRPPELHSQLALWRVDWVDWAARRWPCVVAEATGELR